MADSIINANEIDGADVVLLGAGYEKTASSRLGTANGPKAVIKMLDSKLELFDRTFKMEPSSKIKIGVKDLGDVGAFSPEEMLAKVADESTNLIEQNKFVFLLGGEHSVSLGFLQAFSKKINPKDVTILQIDAHCDLRNNDSDYSLKPTKFAHSCVMRRAHEMGYNLVQVGVRTYYKDEYEYFTNPENRIITFEWGNGKKLPTIGEILESIKTKYIYITIDVDGFDPSFMPGTGTAVQGGLEWWYGIELIKTLIDQKELIGADIVEVSPMRDSILTEYGAAQLCYTIIAHKFRSRLK